ncbi:hypothetical protein H2248_011158 [Termitomyces sp. 'cryptogamus']|nr:hypothetical protein H2248_011158 [Termitomyces sp. 'cryptogamus']
MMTSLEEFLGRLDICDPTLGSNELVWVKYQPFLLSRGYRLRPRYNPDWIPSWPVDQPVDVEPEDSLMLNNFKGLIDAVHIRDEAKVVLKIVQTSSNEIPTALYLSSPDLQHDPRNHTVPILDVLLLPDDDTTALLVMPQLIYFNHLPFRRLGEVTEAFSQYIEGLDFMQEHRILHGDVCQLNLMMEMTQVIPRGVHFVRRWTHDGVNEKLEWKTRWSVRPNKYYFIDFGHSYVIPLHITKPVGIGIYGQDKTVPEFQSPNPYNPFLMEIYQLGNVLMNLIKDYDGLESLLELATAMTRHNPNDRISLRNALDQINRIPKKSLNSRVWRKETPPPFRFMMRWCGKETQWIAF